MKFYELYGSTPHGPFTNQSVAYSRGSHRWIFRVRASSIRQAYAVAYKREMQKDPKGVGVASYEMDWWHHGSLCEALLSGWIKVAKCYGDDLPRALPTALRLSDKEKVFMAELAAAGKATWRANA